MSNEMLSRRLGDTDIVASAVGMGTWPIGGWMWGGTDVARSVAAIQASIDEGITLIDTAPAYGQGVAEEIVGSALKGRREKVVLTSKCGLVWHTQEGNHFFDVDGRPVHRYLGKDAIAYEVEQSLRRLDTDYIDHYITHWQDPTTPIAETMEALQSLKTAGKIRSIGASNTTIEELSSYLDAGRLDAIQEEYSMLKRDIETTLLPVCRGKGVSAISYSSLALGLLAGKIGPDREFHGDDLRKDNPLYSIENRKKMAQFFMSIAPICEAHGASPAQIVIAWTLQQPGITFSLYGARNADQARENAKAGRIALTAEDLAAIAASALADLRDMDG